MWGNSFGGKLYSLDALLAIVEASRLYYNHTTVVTNYTNIQNAAIMKLCSELPLFRMTQPYISHKKLQGKVMLQLHDAEAIIRTWWQNKYLINCNLNRILITLISLLRHLYKLTAQLSIICQMCLLLFNSKSNCESRSHQPKFLNRTEFPKKQGNFNFDFW